MSEETLLENMAPVGHALSPPEEVRAARDDHPGGELRIKADALAGVNLACHQNDVPLIRSLRIVNEGDVPVENIVLRARTSPPVMRPTEWVVDRVAARTRDEDEVIDGEVELTRRNVELDHALLSGLNESETGELTFEIVRDGETLATERRALRLLARDEWGGAADMPAMLAAHVSPNHPAIPPLLKAAADKLEAHGHSRAMDGYQSGDPRRAYMLTAAHWAAMCELGLDYAEPPASFETTGQKVRDPGRIGKERFATCLDTALLMCALAEASGLNASIVLQREHALAGVWLRKRSFDRVVETDPVEVRKAIAAREFIVFETTLACQRPPANFEHACAEARQRLEERNDGEFGAVIDVARARAAHPPARLSRRGR